MKPITTKAHGALDYTTAATLLALPRVWQPLTRSPRAQTILTAMGVMTLLYSLFTRYELGAVKKLPMPLHLKLDLMSGAGLAALPFILSDEESSVKNLFLGLGIFELVATLLSQDKPSEV